MARDERTVQGQFIAGAGIAVYRRVDQWTDLAMAPLVQAEMTAILTREIKATEERVKAALQALDPDIWTEIELDWAPARLSHIHPRRGGDHAE